MIDTATVHRVLDKLGVERVERGLVAFDHEPTGSWCNCFATECFRPELVVPRYEPCVYPTYPTFKSNRERLDSFSIGQVIGHSWNECHRVFSTWYEAYPEELIIIVVDWLVEQDTSP